MGNSWATPALEAPFGDFQKWDHHKAAELLYVFKENEFDFGIDADIVAALLEGDRVRATLIVRKFAPPNGTMINGLAFLAGLVVISGKPPQCADRGLTAGVREKLALVFDTFDLEDSSYITKDEMTIALMSCLRALTVMTGKGRAPSGTT